MNGCEFLLLIFMVIREKKRVSGCGALRWMSKVILQIKVCGRQLE